MRDWLAWLGIGLAMAPCPAVGAREAVDLRVEQAEVTGADGRRLLYRETHYVSRGAPAERWVLYQCPDGRAFARKQVRGSGMAPDFALQDGRDGYGEGVRRDAAARQVYAGTRGKTRTTTLSITDDAVIDAGFDVAVRRHWDALMRGRPLRLRFLVPSRQRLFPVQVQHAGAVQWRGIRAERLRMTLDTWFGFAVPDVELLYASDDRRLLEFRGTGNVRDANGDHPQVRIAFDARPGQATTVELEKVRRMPLDGRCRF